jgi:hypothetical protein
LALTTARALDDVAASSEKRYVVAPSSAPLFVTPLGHL